MAPNITNEEAPAGSDARIALIRTLARDIAPALAASPLMIDDLYDGRGSAPVSVASSAIVAVIKDEPDADVEGRLRAH